ncbi:lysine exporter LysO family protein [Anaerocolumna sp.]|uniref:lysine exporter LysO family protein n=1 Tax=Anaerocolumna sp. TaxID=2041569 RepID=UPI0028A84D7E|nr:lysine exporter LysO family protein [Anaerocolumna sp.]
MVYIAIISLILGIICGQWIFNEQWIQFFTNQSQHVLYALLISVGISVGLNKQVFQKVKEYHLKILLMPMGTIMGSLIGGLIASLFINISWYDSMAIASGLGWYSLSGVMITDLAGIQLGTVAFMSNLMREIIAFIIIPYIARTFNKYTAIAPAGATSEDTSLPMLIKYTNEEVVVMAIFHGVLCSVMVPILIKYIYIFFKG